MSILTHINDIPIPRQPIDDLPFNRHLVTRARVLRKAGNMAEVIFWKQVRNGNFYSIDFDRQRIIGNYIVDFYVKGLALAIEIDGASHNGKEEYDESRDIFIKKLGVRIWRTTDFRIKFDLDNVMKELEVYIIKEYGI